MRTASLPQNWPLVAVAETDRARNRFTGSHPMAEAWAGLIWRGDSCLCCPDAARCARHPGFAEVVSEGSLIANTAVSKPVSPGTSARRSISCRPGSMALSPVSWGCSAATQCTRRCLGRCRTPARTPYPARSASDPSPGPRACPASGPASAPSPSRRGSPS